MKQSKLKLWLQEVLAAIICGMGGESMEKVRKRVNKITNYDRRQTIKI